jgi:hypothetical protein
VRKRWAAVAAIATIVALLNAPLAWSHAGGNPDYRSVIDRVTPKVPGVTFKVLSYDAYIELVDQKGHEVVIYGYEGEPYARILKDGTVQVNDLSPAKYLNDTRYPVESSVPASADPKAPPKWETTDDSGTFVWHDHRMHYGAESTPPQVKDTSQKTKVFDYEIPIEVDGRKGAIDGTLYWVGQANTSKLPFVVVGLLILLGGGGAVLYARRRRDGAGGSPDRADRPAEPSKEAW